MQGSQLDSWVQLSGQSHQIVKKSSNILNKIIYILTFSHVMSFPDFEKPFALHLVASAMRQECLPQMKRTTTCIQYCLNFWLGNGLTKKFKDYLLNILLSTLMILLPTLSVMKHLICGNKYSLLLNLFWPTRLGQIIADWGRKWLVDFNARKTQIVLCDQSKSSGAIDVKMDRSVPEEKSFFQTVGISLSSKLDEALILSLLLKLPSIKLEPWFLLWELLLLRLLFVSINLPYNLAWNTANMPGLVLLPATWIC